MFLSQARQLLPGRLFAGAAVADPDGCGKFDRHGGMPPTVQMVGLAWSS